MKCVAFMLKQNQTFLWVFILQHVDQMSQSSSRDAAGQRSFEVSGSSGVRTGSAFDDGDGPQLDGLLADSGVVTRVHHVRHVLVRLWSLRGNKHLVTCSASR